MKRKIEFFTQEEDTAPDVAIGGRFIGHAAHGIKNSTGKLKINCGIGQW